MTTRILINIALFFVPFIVYFAYARWANARRAVNGTDPLQTPWFWLVIAGLACAVAGFVVPQFFVKPNSGQYVPAQVIDGKLVPGHFEGDNDQKPHIEPPHAPPPGSPQP